MKFNHTPQRERFFATSIVTLALTALTSLHSANALAGEKSVTGLLGFSQSALNIGANFENKIEQNLGVGGYFIHSSEKKENAGKQQVMSFGATATGHFIDNSTLNAYLAPGFGVMMVKGLSGSISGDDQTTFGPIWKIGFLFKATANIRAGIERTELVNWFSDKAYPNAVFTNAAINFSF